MNNSLDKLFKHFVEKVMTNFITLMQMTGYEYKEFRKFSTCLVNSTMCGEIAMLIFNLWAKGKVSLIKVVFEALWKSGFYVRT